MYAGYLAWMFLGTAAPGLAIWQAPLSTYSELLHESLNFFYINNALAAVGANFAPCVAEHPVSEALVQLVNAWGLLFVPLLLDDPRLRDTEQLALRCAAVVPLANLAFIPLLARHARPQPHPSGLPFAARTRAALSPAGAAEAAAAMRAAASAPAPPRRPPVPEAAARAAAAVGGLVAAVSIGWALAARPDAGDLAARAAYAAQKFSGDRVFYAYAFDLGSYGFWQAWLMADAGAPRRFCAVPLFGLAAWLLAGRPVDVKASA